MSAKLIRAGIALAIAATVFVSGYALGHRRTFAWTTQWLTAETQFNLSQRVDTLARLRTGDTAGAITGLEQAVDTATLSLSRGKPWSESQPEARSTFQLVKAYRSRYPPSQPSQELSAFLESIPMPDVRYCSPALQQLLRTPKTDLR